MYLSDKVRTTYVIDIICVIPSSRPFVSFRFLFRFRFRFRPSFSSFRHPLFSLRQLLSLLSARHSPFCVHASVSHTLDRILPSAETSLILEKSPKNENLRTNIRDDGLRKRLERLAAKGRGRERERVEGQDGGQAVVQIRNSKGRRG